MNDHGRWRLDLAHDLSAHLPRCSELRAVVVGGSVARGYSDAYSDLELILLWDSAPDPEVRRAIRADLRAEFRYPATDPGHDSALLIRGVPVDLWHNTVAHWEAALDAVLREYSTDLVASNMLDTLQTCLPLSGTDLVQQWQHRAGDYPEELTLRFLQTYLPHFHLRHLNMAARRDNPTAFYHTLSDIQCSLFLILLAVNRSHFPTYKWLYQRLAELPIGPPQLAPRLRQMFREPPLRAAAQLHDVLLETLAIVEARYPQLDPAHTARARYGLAQTPHPLVSAT